MESDRWPRLFAQMHFASDTTWRTRDLVTFSHIMDSDDHIEGRVLQNIDLILPQTQHEGLATLSHFMDLKDQI